MYDSLTSSKEVIHKSQELYQQEGIDPFIAILQNADPLTLQKLHFNDHYRLRRAVEHWWMTQTPLSKVHLSKSQENKNFPYWKEQG